MIEGLIGRKVGMTEVFLEDGTLIAGTVKKAGIPPVRILMEFEVLKGKVDDYKSGDVIKAEIFKEGDIIDISGTSKGKGFAGVMKRHGFSGQPDSHGGMSHRKPGSIGQHSYPARVWKGIKMPGHMGAERGTMQGLRGIKVETEKDIGLVK